VVDDGDMQTGQLQEVLTGGDGGPSVEADEVDWETLAREAVADCSVSARGHITCSREPWRSRGLLGRVTEWPAKAPRSVSMRCLAHARCTWAAVRREVTDAQLIQWLLLAVTVPAEGSAADQAAMHMSMPCPGSSAGSSAGSAARV
jgi:hypothetical protein